MGASVENIVEVTPPAWSTLADPTFRSNTMAWAASADGRRFLVTGSDDGISRFWNASTGECGPVLARHDDWVNSVACASLPTGQLLVATGGKDRVVRVWGAGSGRELCRLEDHAGGVNAVAWVVAPDGRALLASGGDDATVRVWDGATGRALHRIPVGQDHISLVYAITWAVLPTGQVRLAAANEGLSGGWVVHLWDGLTGVELRTLAVPPADQGVFSKWGSVALAVESDGRLLMAANASGVAYAWAAETGEPLYAASGDAAKALAWARTRAGDLVLIVAAENSMTVLDGYTGHEVTAVDVVHDGWFRSFAVTSSHDGAILIAAAWKRDTPARIWRIE